VNAGLLLFKTPPGLSLLSTYHVRVLVSDAATLWLTNAFSEVRAESPIVRVQPSFVPSTLMTASVQLELNAAFFCADFPPSSALVLRTAFIVTAPVVLTNNEHVNVSIPASPLFGPITLVVTVYARPTQPASASESIRAMQMLTWTSANWAMPQPIIVVNLPVA